MALLRGSAVVSIGLSGKKTVAIESLQKSE